MEFTESLKKNEDFRKVYRTGKSYANKYLVMYIRRNSTDKNRLGISVSKKVGNSVIRNRLTRLVRESYRLSEDCILKGFDIVIVVRRNARDISYLEMKSALLHLVKIHRIENDRNS